MPWILDQSGPIGSCGLVSPAGHLGLIWNTLTWPSFFTQAEALAAPAIAAINAITSSCVIADACTSNVVDTANLVGGNILYFRAAGSSYQVHYTFVPSYIKRVQNYSVKVTNSPQSLCSLKETAFTKISGFRKYTL